MKIMGVSLCQCGALSLFQAVSLEGQSQGCPQLQLIKSKTKRIQWCLWIKVVVWAEVSLVINGFIVALLIDPCFSLWP